MFSKLNHLELSNGMWFEKCQQVSRCVNKLIAQNVLINLILTFII